MSRLDGTFTLTPLPLARLRRTAAFRPSRAHASRSAESRSTRSGFAVRLRLLLVLFLLRLLEADATGVFVPGELHELHGVRIRFHHRRVRSRRRAERMRRKR